MSAALGLLALALTGGLVGDARAAACPDSETLLRDLGLAANADLSRDAQSMADSSAERVSNGSLLTLSGQRDDAAVLKTLKDYDLTSRFPDGVGLGCRAEGDALYLYFVKPRPQTRTVVVEVPPVSGDLKAEMLAAHNRLRCQHGAPPLQWRDDVAAYARAWAEGGGPERGQHSDAFNSPIGPMGENMAAGDFRSYGEMVEMWYAEVAFYDFENPGNKPTVAGEPVGHFTALIWTDAKYLGCGQDGKRFSCNYWNGDTRKTCSSVNITSDGENNCYATRVPPLVPEASCD